MPHAQWRVIVRYDDPRGGIWRGPLETKVEAQKRLIAEKERVRGHASLEYVGRDWIEFTEEE